MIFNESPLIDTKYVSRKALKAVKGGTIEFPDLGLVPEKAISYSVKL